MKKIISLLSVFAMIATMFTTVSFAADNEVVFTEVNKTTNSVDIQVSLNTTYTDIQSVGLFFDMKPVIAKGATVTATNGVATFKYVANQQMVSVAFAPTDGSKYVSGQVLGTITVTGIAENFDIALAPKTSRTTSKITSVADGDLMYGSNVVFAPETFVTSVKMVEEAKTTMDKPVAGKDMYGMKTALTKIAFKDVENPVVRLYKDDVESDKSKAGYELPANVKGNAEIIGIIRYTDAGTYKLSVFDGETEVVSTSYVAE